MSRVLVLLLSFVVVGCKSTTGPDTVVFGQPFWLKVGESMTFPDGNWMLFSRLVSDSRCPIDAVCVSAGDAVISVAFKIGHVVTEVHTDPSRSQISYSGGHTIRLTELQPYPRASAPSLPEDYAAKFVVQ